MSDIERDEEIQDRANHNLAEFFEKGPGLRFSTRSWVIAKDTANDMVYLGGLGGMGVGQMWTRTRDYNREDSTYAEAPEVAAPADLVEQFRQVEEDLSG